VHAALETLRDWAADEHLELVQVQVRGGHDQARVVAPPGDLNACDLIAAIGGDGTVLTALHASAETQTPVLGVACGSLGALSMVSVAELRAGLDRIAAGDWRARRLPALVVDVAARQPAYAVNDFVLVRRGGTQLVVAVSMGSDLYARLAGDGVVVATPLGSSAYSMAAGGPLLVDGTNAFVCTPLAMHGGCAPPLVVPADREVVLDADPGHGGFDVEVDGHRVESTGMRFAVGIEENYATLVDLGDPDRVFSGLRRRGLITDSPRVLAREVRTAHDEVETTPG
jgi:NAD+ kinase